MPFQVVGGLAAQAHGCKRELWDIDIYIPMRRLEEIWPQIQQHVAWGPQHFRDQFWELTFLKIKYADQRIELADADDAMFFDRQNQVWRKQKIDFHSSEIKEILGLRVPVMSKAQLIEYKHALSRDVDLEDLRQLS